MQVRALSSSVSSLRSTACKCVVSGHSGRNREARILSLAIRFQKPQVNIGLVPLDLNADLFKLLSFLRE